MDISMLSQRGYSVEKAFLPREKVEKMHEEALFLSGKGRFRGATVGKNASSQRDESIRGDKIHWLNVDFPSETQQLLLFPLEKLRLRCNEELLLGLRSLECHYAHYPVGSLYQRHRDAFRNDDARILSMVFYLNLDWKPGDGGELLLHLGSGPLRIEPVGGTLVTFLSREIEHEVLPAHVDRWSVAGWFKNQSSALV